MSKLRKSIHVPSCLETTYQIAEVVVAVGVLASMTQRRDVADLGVGGLAQRRLHDAEVHPGGGEVWAETDGALQQLLGLDVLAARLQDVCQIVHRLVVARVQPATTGQDIS